MSIQLQPPVPLVTLIKTEHPTVIKNEPPEEAFEKETSPDIKDINIVYHSLSEDLIKSETVPDNIPETKYSESVETQVLVKTEDTSDENVTRDTVVEIVETTSWEKYKEKIKVIKAPVIPVKPYEYTSLAKDKHVCNHCQYACNRLNRLRCHIKRMHREVTTMYQCPYCPYKSKWSVREHIILKHKYTKDIQWFQCHLCEKKFKLKRHLKSHMMIHLEYKQMQDGLALKRYYCAKCDYKTYKSTNLKIHKLTHLKPEEIQYFYCYHCSYKAKLKGNLKKHIFRHFKKEQGRI